MGVIADGWRFAGVRSKFHSLVKQASSAARAKNMIDYFEIHKIGLLTESQKLTFEQVGKSGYTREIHLAMMLILIYEMATRHNPEMAFSFELLLIAYLTAHMSIMPPSVVQYASKL